MSKTDVLYFILDDFLSKKAVRGREGPISKSLDAFVHLEEILFQKHSAT